MSKLIYLDHAATMPLDESVRAAMEPYLQDLFYNPSSLYRPAREVRLAIETARKSVAGILGGKPTEIIWTSGGTESINLAVQGVLRRFPGAHWVTTAIEHEAVLAQCTPLETQCHMVTIVPVVPSGVVKPQDVLAAVTDRTVLVSVMLANNEVGTIQAVGEIGRRLERVREERRAAGNELPIYLHTDACQAAAYHDLHVTRLGVDLLSLNGSKIYGPKGTGLLYVRYGTELEPLIYGGGQERGRRSGTENVAGVIGLAAALSLVQGRRAAESKRLMALRDRLITGILEGVPEAQLNGDRQQRLPGNVNVTIPGVDGQTLVLYLEQAGILTSTGSACAAGDDEPSHVLLALGCTPAEAASSLRLTLGHATTMDQIETVIRVLPPIVRRLRQIT